jgi:hypothetical protein
MENDTIRASGGNTLVDLWIDGQMRSICVSREAIEYLCDEAAATEKDRCEFVRTHLALIIKGARERLKDGLVPGVPIVLVAGQLDPAGSGRGGRKTERRKGDRRKREDKAAMPPAGDRRRADRRKGDRRRSPKETGQG